MEEKSFTIKQAAMSTGVSQDTIRYYEKISLLARAERKENGHRVYRQEDLDTLRLIACLKKTGMPLDQMKPFLAVGAGTDPAEYPELVERLRSHRETILSQIASLQQVVDFIDLKLAEGDYRGDCQTDGNNGETAKSREETRRTTASSAELSYFAWHSDNPPPS